MPPLTLRKLAQDLGPVFFLQLGEVPTVVVSSAAMAKEVMKTHDLAFCSRPQLYSAKWLFYNCTNSVFSPYGAYWRHVRKICILELLSTKMVQSYDFVRKEEVCRFVNRIADSCNQEISLTKVLGLYANDVLCRVVLGRNFSEGGEYDLHGFQSMLDDYQELLGGLSIGDFFPSKEFVHTLTGHKSRLKKTFKRFDSFFNKVIQEHLSPQRKTEGAKDLRDVLLDIKKDGSSEMPLTMDNIKAILLDMFAAGTDTSFIILDWGMTEMIMNSEVMKKAQTEVRSVLKERKTVLESDLPQLHYLKAVIKEIFRLHPPVPVLVPRESIKDVTIEGYDIPAKTWVFINDFELLPFGAGRRGCPGIIFGTVTIELALAQLLHSFDWDLPPGVEAKDLDLSEAFGISMHKTSDLIVVAKPQLS
uniref:Cytochrome P450 71A1 n=1 Tax=Chenopodium quinoa TaxID=63459 RepID=A0A803KQB4_CHEQI